MTITAEQKYLLNNKSGRVANKVQLGTLIENAETVSAGEFALASGQVFIGNVSGVATATAMTSGQLIVGDGSNLAAVVSVTGDVLISSSGVTSIATGVIVNADISASAAIAFSKFAALTSGNILVGSSGNVPTSVAMSGDVTISNAGVTAIGANKVTKAMLATDVMVEATGTLSQANLQAIGTPISLVAAAGAGKVIVVDELELLHSYSTTQYATGADLQFEYETSGTNWALVDAAFVTAAASKSVIIHPSCYDLDASSGTAEGFDVTSMANKGIQVTGSNFTNGNAANVVKWRIRYHVITLIT